MTMGHNSMRDCGFVDFVIGVIYEVSDEFDVKIFLISEVS